MRRLLLVALAALTIVAAVLAVWRPGAEGAQGGGTTEDELEAMTRDDLYELARRRNIRGRSRMKKAELRDALRRA